jgi:hypothetical protein
MVSLARDGCSLENIIPTFAHRLFMLVLTTLKECKVVLPIPSKQLDVTSPRALSVVGSN